MGLFGGGNSSSSTSNDNRNLSLSAGNGALQVGADATAIGVDPNVINAYLGGVTAQTDAVKSLAGFSADELKNMGESVTHIYDVAGSNALTSWEHTIDKSADITAAQTATAGTLAQQAVMAASPNASTNDTITKVAMYAAIAVVALFMFRKKAG